MPNTLSQSKALYDKAARSTANRRAWLLREKATRFALRSAVVTPTVTTSSPPRVSQGKQQLLQLKARLASEQAARTRGRITHYENFNQQPHTVVSFLSHVILSYMLWFLYTIFRNRFIILLRGTPVTSLSVA